MKRKLLSILLTFCLAFSLLPTAALADGEETPQAEGGEQKTYVAQIGEEKYETLQAAINEAKSGDTIVLKKSIRQLRLAKKAASVCKSRYERNAGFESEHHNC